MREGVTGNAAGLLDGRAWPSEQTPPDHASTLLLLFNAHHEDVGFIMPAAAGPDPWLPLLDTAAETLDRTRGYAVGLTARLVAHSLAVCMRGPGLSNVVGPSRCQMQRSSLKRRL